MSRVEDRLTPVDVAKESVRGVAATLRLAANGKVQISARFLGDTADLLDAILDTFQSAEPEARSDDNDRD
jgi:hypothetical protein